jgi:hypothetical protein
MATPKLQVGRALEVIPSSDCEIPFPNNIIDSATTATSVGQIVDTSVDFIALNVSVGDIVYIYSTGLAATITNVVDANTLDLNADIAVVGDNYKVYVGGENNGCVFHISSSDPTDTFRCDIITIGGDVLGKLYLSPGYHPIQIKSFLGIVSASGSAAKIIALW